MIVYSPSDQAGNLKPSDQEDLLQYLYPRAQMDENANPRTFAAYGNTSNVPVSLTVDDLQPSTTYLIFVHVQMLYQVSTLSYIRVCFLSTKYICLSQVHTMTYVVYCMD